MSKSKFILIFIYLSLILSSGYNLFSYKKPYDMKANMSKHISVGLKTYLEIANHSDGDWKNVNIVLDKTYVLHLNELKEDTSYNAFLWEFIPIDYRPIKSGRIQVWDSTTRGELFKILDKKKEFSLELYIDGGYHYQKL